VAAADSASPWDERSLRRRRHSYTERNITASGVSGNGAVMVDGVRYHGQYGDDSFEEQVEEENASGAAEQTVDDDRQLAAHSAGRCHAVTWSVTSSS